MKKTNLFIKLLAAVLIVCTATMLFASCNKKANTVAMSFKVTIDGVEKEYTITEQEYDMLLKIRKRAIFTNFATSLIQPSSKNTATFWAGKSSEEGKTNEQYYMDIVTDQVKSVLVEKYLFEKYGLTISQNTLDGYQTSLKSAVKEAGGKGAYKQYYGYTAADFYDIYAPMEKRSTLLFDHLTSTKNGGTGEIAATAADLKAYYEEHFVGYQYIVIDTANKIKLDENGNRVFNKVKDDKGNEIDGDTYATETLSTEEKEKKQTLADEVLKKLENKEITFEEAIAQYSDEYKTVKYSEGWFLDKEATFINATVTDKVKNLEVGEMLSEVISSSAKRYIVKRVELKANVYDEFEKDENGEIVKNENGNAVENKYFEVFSDFEENVNYDKYEKFVESFFDKITVATEVTGKYTMADTFLSPYAEDYYNMLVYYYFGGNLK